MGASTAVDLPSYVDTYTANYRHTVLASENVGTSRAALISFKRPPGRYCSGATSDFTLTMVQNGGFGAKFDLGMGTFRVHTTPGQLFLAPPFTRTENAFDGVATGAVIALQHTRVAELLHDEPVKPEALFRELYTRPVSDDFIRLAINQLLSLTRPRRSTDTLFADGALLAIFAALARHSTTRSARAIRGLADWQLRRVTEKLESLQDVSLAELAAAANLSPFYFARAFKQSTGLPPHHFQQRVRIERAKELLADPSLSVTEIALRVGYGSSQTLARVFRKNVGFTPAEYRRGITM
jgi:AraC family transcriptional regulator